MQRVIFSILVLSVVTPRTARATDKRYIVASLEADQVAAASLAALGQTRTEARPDGWNYFMAQSGRQLTWSTESCLGTANFNDPDENGGCANGSASAYVGPSEGGECVGVQPSTRALAMVVEYRFQRHFEEPVIGFVSVGGETPCRHLTVVQQRVTARTTIWEDVFRWSDYPRCHPIYHGSMSTVYPPVPGDGFRIVISPPSNTNLSSTRLQLLVTAQCRDVCNSSDCAAEYRRTCIENAELNDQINMCGVTTTVAPISTSELPSPVVPPDAGSQASPSPRKPSDDDESDDSTTLIIVVAVLSGAVVILLTTTVTVCVVHRTRRQAATTLEAPDTTVQPVVGVVTVQPDDGPPFKPKLLPESTTTLVQQPVPNSEPKWGGK